MSAFKPLIWGLLASALLVQSEAQAEKRVALVIGNSTYSNVRPLTNPANDAIAIADLFRAAGFDVVEAQNNLNAVAMRRAVRNFSDTVRNADIAVVYYAGHGMEADGANYLLPIDAVLERDLDLEDEALSVERVVRTLEPAKRLRLIILDACRDNPFVNKMKRISATRSIGRGLAKVEPESSDTLIAFAARAGSTAADGEGAHSPFTAALLKYITTPGLDVRLALGRVRDEVLRTTNSRQEPFVYGSLGGTTVALVSAKAPEPPPARVAAPAAPVDPNAVARGDYEFASKIGSMEVWDAFLVQHPTGFYADLAKAQRERLTAAKVAVVPPPAPPPPETRKPAVDLSEVAHQMHKELTRLGCYAGDVDDPWSRSSRRAMETFNRNSGMKLDVSAASTDSLGALRDKTGRVCPLECRPGFIAENGRCERKPADTAERHKDKRRDEKRRETKQTDTERPRERRRAQASGGGAASGGGGGGGARVVCGMNGCIDVKPGCRGENRPSGSGSVAVSICGQ